MAHRFGTGDEARLSNEPLLCGCKCTDSGFLIERIQQSTQRKKRGNALDNLPEPPALVTGERLAAAPTSRIAATFSRRSATSARIAAAFAANISERQSSEVVRTVIGVGHLIIAPIGQTEKAQPEA
jgi:hypothetical protein